MDNPKKVYDFDEMINRRNNNSDKWTAYSKDILPMWIADMDFTAADEIVNGLIAMSEKGVYGYGKSRPDRLLEAIIYRLQRLYGWTISKESIVMLPSLVTGFNIAANLVARRDPESSYMFHTPAYPPFFAIENNVGVTGIGVPLKELVEGNKLRYEIDFEAMEQAITEKTAILMLCNPQNPSGRMFTREELEKIADFAKKHDLLVLSDEIHAELNWDRDHIPFASLSDDAKARTITLISASKTFNLPGLSGGFALIENDALREEYNRAMMGFIPRMNVYAIKGAELAFDYGDEWLSQLKPYLIANRDYLVQELSTIEGLKMVVPEATFLMWLDFSETSLGEEAYRILLEHGLALNDGKTFGATGNYVRLNFGAPRQLVEKAVDIIEKSLN